MNKRLKDIVFFVLKNFEKARDNDEYCVLCVWYRQSDILKNESASYNEFKHLFLSKNISSADAITRTRRQLQEEFIELRGKEWGSRQNKSREYKQYEKRDKSIYSKQF